MSATRPLLRTLSSLLPATARGRLLLTAITLAALALRVPGMQWGLPDGAAFAFHPDEPTNLGAPLRMLESGTLDPGFFHYGTLYSYLVWLPLLPLWLTGAAGQMADCILVGRLVTLLMGVATVPVVFALGRELRDDATGLVAAALLAVAPAHVMHSAFATVDVPSTWFVSVSLLLALRFSLTGSRATLAGATLACGLAAATKYPAGMVGLASVAAVAVVRGTNWTAWLRDAGVLIGGAAAGFLVGCPYAALDFATFWQQMTYELLTHATEGHSELFAHTGPGSLYLLFTNLPYGFGPVALLLSAAGTVVLLRARDRRVWVLLAFALPYMILLSAAQIRFMRYCIVLVPVLGVAAAVAMVTLYRAVPSAGRRRAATAAAALLLAAPAVVQSACFLRADSRLAAVAAADELIGDGAEVAMIAPPDWHTAPLALRPRSYGGFDLSRLTRERPEWFIVSEFFWQYDAGVNGLVRQRFLDTLDRDYQRAHCYSAFPHALRWLFGNPAAPHDWLYPFPEIRIYRLGSPAARPGR